MHYNRSIVEFLTSGKIRMIKLLMDIVLLLNYGTSTTVIYVDFFLRYFNEMLLY